MKTGARIKAARRDLEMKQDYLAGAAGICQSTLSKIEAGHTDPSFTVMVRIARNTGRSLEDFAPDRPFPDRRNPAQGQA